MDGQRFDLRKQINAMRNFYFSSSGTLNIVPLKYKNTSSLNLLKLSCVGQFSTRPLFLISLLWSSVCKRALKVKREEIKSNFHLFEDTKVVFTTLVPNKCFDLCIPRPQQPICTKFSPFIFYTGNALEIFHRFNLKSAQTLDLEISLCSWASLVSPSCRDSKYFHTLDANYF